MRINHYEFETDRLAFENGCPALMNDGTYRSCDEMYADGSTKHYSFDEIEKEGYQELDKVVTCSVTLAKALLKKFGGKAWTNHYDRDGGLFEVTNIELKKNNSHFKYSYHL